MSILPNFLRSLLLTSLLTFAAPILLVGGVLASLSILSYIPILEAMGQTGAAQVCMFLAVFGNGCPLEGILVIGLACGLVGALFDTYTFYHYQNLRGS